MIRLTILKSKATFLDSSCKTRCQMATLLLIQSVCRMWIYIWNYFNFMTKAWQRKDLQRFFIVSDIRFAWILFCCKLPPFYCSVTELQFATVTAEAVQAFFIIFFLDSIWRRNNWNNVALHTTIFLSYKSSFVWILNAKCLKSSNIKTEILTSLVLRR